MMAERVVKVEYNNYEIGTSILSRNRKEDQKALKTNKQFMES
jgi:hypothetical protein